jgi:hypothetical protein
MKHTQRGSAPAAMLFVVLALIIGIGLYFYLGKSATPSYKYSDTVVTSTTSTVTTPAPTSTTVTPPKNVTLDLSTQFAQQYRTILNTALQTKADFNGHYVVASIGCGTGCFGYAVVDKSTGSVYRLPVSNDVGEAAPPASIGAPYSLSGNTIKVFVDSGAKIATYSFNGSEFSLVSTTAVSR